MYDSSTTIAVIGAGYVGLTTAVGFAELGYKVTLAESDKDKISTLRRGVVPFKEPKLPELLKKHLGASLRLETDITQLTNCKYVFICVGTPSNDDNSADLGAVFSVLYSISRGAPPSQVWIVKSSIPPGTTQKLCSDLGLDSSQLVFNPEFLREGRCVDDFMSPDRIVIGTENVKVLQELQSLYSPIETEVISCTPTEAELIKYASNSALAVKLSFANEISDLCDAMNADVKVVLGGVGSDTRIGIGMLVPGPGWGGSCLPKDTRALIYSASQLDVTLSMVASATQSNSIRAERITNTLLNELRRLGQKSIAVWGLTFKAETDDLRESPALAIIDLLLEAGTSVTAFDPAIQNGSLIDPRVKVAHSALEACGSSELLVVMTEWKGFSEIAGTDITQHTKINTVLDTRRILARSLWETAGVRFLRIGQ